MNVLVCKLILLAFNDDAGVAGVMRGMMRKLVLKVRLMCNGATPSGLWRTVRVETIAGDHKFTGGVYSADSDCCQRIQTAR